MGQNRLKKMHISALCALVGVLAACDDPANTNIAATELTEIDAKLQTIQVQIGAVQATQEVIKEQSERQTAEIIRRIERLDTPR